MSSAATGQGTAHYTVPGLQAAIGERVAGLLQRRLGALIELTLTLKHAHWNVIGPNFIGVHTMLDPQVQAVRAMVDETAERIAVLGLSPVGTPGALVAARSGTDYPLRRADALSHLAALDAVYTEVLEGHRSDLNELAELDLVSQEMLIEQAKQLEQFQWFIRAHLESAGGTLPPAAE